MLNQREGKRGGRGENKGGMENKEGSQGREGKGHEEEESKKWVGGWGEGERGRRSKK